jgi:hypothetical protein
MLSYAFLVSTLVLIKILIILCSKHEANLGLYNHRIRIPIKRNWLQERDEL